MNNIRIICSRTTKLIKSCIQKYIVLYIVLMKKFQFFQDIQDINIYNIFKEIQCKLIKCIVSICDENELNYSNNDVFVCIYNNINISII